MVTNMNSATKNHIRPRLSKKNSKTEQSGKYGRTKVVRLSAEQLAKQAASRVPSGPNLIGEVGHSARGVLPFVANRVLDFVDNEAYIAGLVLISDIVRFQDTDLASLSSVNDDRQGLDRLFTKDDRGNTLLEQLASSAVSRDDFSFTQALSREVVGQDMITAVCEHSSLYKEVMLEGEGFAPPLTLDSKLGPLLTLLFDVKDAITFVSEFLKNTDLMYKKTVFRADALQHILAGSSSPDQMKVFIKQKIDIMIDSKVVAVDATTIDHMALRHLVNSSMMGFINELKSHVYLLDVLTARKKVIDSLLSTSVDTNFSHFLDRLLSLPSAFVSQITNMTYLRNLLFVKRLGCLIKSTYSAETLLEWLYLAGFEDFDKVLGSSRTDDRMYNLFVKYYCDFMSGRYEPRQKFVTALVQGRGLDFGRDEPTRPKWCSPNENHFLVGAAYSWFAGRTQHSGEGMDKVLTDLGLRLLNEVNGIRKRQPTIPSWRLLDSLKGWEDDLFLKQRQPSPKFASIRHSIYSNIRYIVDQLPLGSVGNFVLPTPGVKARLESNRGLLGTFGHIQRLMTEVADIIKVDLDYYTGLVDESLESHKLRAFDSYEYDYDTMDFAQPTTRRVVHQDDGYGELARYAFESYSSHIAGTFYYQDPLTSLFTDQEAEPLASIVVSQGPIPLIRLFEMALIEFDQSGLPVRGVSLPEPFKVRMISMGSCLSTWLQSMFQKSMHRALQKFPEFQITKETPDNDIVDILNNCFGNRTTLNKDQFFVSGDYKASTDNLSPYVSDMVCDAISDKMRLGGFSSRLLKASLTGHRLINRDSDGPSHVRQRWGQLMGSPTSFPVLCIANLAITMAALNRGKRDHSRRRLGTSGICVNGDDVGFSCVLDEYTVWKDYATWCGLAPSEGKNFKSRQFLQLNSKMFVPRTVHGPLGLNEQRRHKLFEYIPSVSLAILSVGDGLSVNPPTLGEFGYLARSLQSAFLAGASNDRDRDRLNQIWLSCWSDQLKHLTYNGHVNWFIPVCFGGFGLQATRPIEANLAQLRAAAWFRDHTLGPTPKLRYEITAGLTNLHEVEQKCMERLAQESIVELVAVNGSADDPEEFMVPNLVSLVALSGYAHGNLKESEYRDKKGQPIEIDSWTELQGKDKLLAQTNTGLVANFDDKRHVCLFTEAKEKVRPERGFWVHNLKTVRDAASATARTMSLEELNAHLNTRYIWTLKPGVTYKSSFGMNLSELTPALSLIPRVRPVPHNIIYNDAVHVKLAGPVDLIYGPLPSVINSIPYDDLRHISPNFLQSHTDLDL